jgi:hypothetical protein
LSKRLIRWVTFNVIFALLPLIVLLVLRQLAGKLSSDDLAASPEILFFALMVSATAMGDLSEVLPAVGWSPTFGILGSFMLLGAVFSAILYGGLLSSLLFGDILGPAAKSFRSGLLIMSVCLAVVLLIVSTLTEILLGKIEAK